MFSSDVEDEDGKDGDRDYSDVDRNVDVEESDNQLFRAINDEMDDVLILR